MYKLKLDLPNVSKGGTVALSGIGRELENGKEHEITDEEAALYEVLTGKSFKDAFKDDKTVTVTKTANKSIEGGDGK